VDRGALFDLAFDGGPRSGGTGVVDGAIGAVSTDEKLVEFLGCGRLTLLCWETNLYGI